MIIEKTSTRSRPNVSPGVPKRLERPQRFLLALGSAFLLIAAFPNFNQPWCAWVALVPWLVLLRETRGRRAFWWSWFIGVLFFLGSIWWLTYVTIIGWLILCAYLAVFFGLFGLLVSRGCLQPSASSLQPLLIPPAWVALEYLRTHLLSGLGWNLLAYSQTPWRRLIQVADVTGAWGVSFLIVLVNVAIAAWFGARNPGERQRAGRSLLSAVCCLLSALLYGTWRLQSLQVGPPVRVAVVQGNIPQEEKWDAAHREAILQRYEALTRDAALTQPDLIVWPETSTPDALGLDEALTQRVTALARAVKIPLLIGTPMGRFERMTWRWTNSAALVETDGTATQRYDKLHLVPLGEFIPFEGVFPWLRDALPPIGDFVPGREYTVFQFGSRLKAQGSRQEPSSLEPSASSLQRRFSVLICFEDTFPNLARRFARQGAQLLLVITNDAWFGPTAAAYQHAQASVFRSVELRVPVVRAANTGWSGCIDSRGRWIGSVRDARGQELFVEGTHTCDLPLSSAESLYRRWGDWFAWLCLLFTIINPFLMSGLRKLTPLAGCRIISF